MVCEHSNCFQNYTREEDFQVRLDILTLMKRPLVGAHVSVAGGLYTCFERAKDIGAEAIQIFGASPRGWAAKLLDKEAVQKFKNAHHAAGEPPVFLHAAYLPNPASPDKEAREKSVANLSAHLAIAEAIGAVGLIFHLGSGKELPKEEAIKVLVECIRQILKNVRGNALLIMENSAGGGQKIGGAIEDMGALFNDINSARVKVCIDTAHTFESGVVMKYDSSTVKQLANKLDTAFGLENLAALHANDSMTLAGSHHDRHENIGKGYIGTAGFKALSLEPRLLKAPWLLEVPGIDGNGPDAENISLLKKLF